MKTHLTIDHIDIVARFSPFPMIIALFEKQMGYLGMIIIFLIFSFTDIDFSLKEAYMHNFVGLIYLSVALGIENYRSTRLEPVKHGP